MIQKLIQWFQKKRGDSPQIQIRFIFDYRLVAGKKTMTKRKYWIPIGPDDPRYASAQCSESVVNLL